MSDQFDQANNQGENSPKNQEQDQFAQFEQGPSAQQNTQQLPQQQQDIDEFFGSSQIQQPNLMQNNEMGGQQPVFVQPESHFDENMQSQKQAPLEAYNQPESNPINQVDFQQQLPSQQLSQEEQDRIARKQKYEMNEQARIHELAEKQDTEYKDKMQKKAQAQDYLTQWKNDRLQLIQKRKEQNRQEQQALIIARKQKTEYKNPWAKVVDNISLKVSDVQGSKDITRMKEAILNKKGDIQKTLDKQQ